MTRKYACYIDNCSVNVLISWYVAELMSQLESKNKLHVRTLTKVGLM